MGFENCALIEQSPRNFYPSSSNRKFYSIFASPNRYFIENSRWVPLSKMFVCPVPKISQVMMKWCRRASHLGRLDLLIVAQRPLSYYTNRYIYFMWHNGRRAKQPGFIHACTRSRTHFQTVTNHADKYEGLIQSKILPRLMKIGRFNKHRSIVLPSANYWKWNMYALRRQIADLSMTLAYVWKMNAEDTRIWPKAWVSGLPKGLGERRF